ncbi:acyl-ACP--UDP-N-acetylglucosamine O-acyltransferase [Candidatus Aminicenantes bacterium AC-708-M15]|jgi:UDP-N-acetylglucosamine acyltransferase|nr:acyl-ACP--UDP-N-acetylglucosamine O-acyltransferase [SCandidatus Aminicenantes bacterium Aminicenantia_JdfR_composite]MCP2597958.1 acyl-ACP--UDP-N-acetylglucosamine O-acyltransferase [Candidatus Aminicenantes bacterium AC-335-L06]MCP2604238.1 acyl-ACP--UDP-N-acetylglucosamine O-acyltransferase [Candidatus Aminicenantes bacterium AC-708-M15]MCP2606442.1 acyl-ACP--UDP-N-acetylglucosamine O-acyltransferase [Candidatus Aminicenantes bacterium AC-708-I09]MCP2618167.1 acyl-ACP--UDP-N-acetylglucosa
MRNEVFIDERAYVHPHAELDVGVEIGPFCIIDKNVRIGKGTKIAASVYITGNTEIGENCYFSPYSSIGTEPQDLTYKGEETGVKIGNNNVFREFITVHRGTVKGGGITLIGNNNYFMAYTHIAHDCKVGNDTIFINGATLGGHVKVDDFATIGAFSGVHQFCRVGKYAFIGGYSIITQDVIPFARVAGGRPPLIFGVNVIGLRRRGFPNEKIKILKNVFKIIFWSDMNTSQALKKIQEEFDPIPEIEEIINFIRTSKRGIIKKRADAWDIELV